jgi:hypothetical protein
VLLSPLPAALALLLSMLGVIAALSFDPANLASRLVPVRLSAVPVKLA